MTISSRKKQAASPRAKRPAQRPSFDAIIADQLRDPEFRAAWETSEPKRRIVGALLRLRAQANLSQKELAEKAGWQPAFVSRLESFPDTGERLYMPDLSTLQSYARACGCEVGLVFGRTRGRGARVDIAATTSFGEHEGFRRALAALTGTEVSLARGGQPRITPEEKPKAPGPGRTRRRG